MGTFLGIHLGGHDSSACVLDGGRLAVGIQQERLNRIKHSSLNINHGLVEYCLEAAGVCPADVDEACLHHVNFPPLASGTPDGQARKELLRRWLVSKGIWHRSFDSAKQLSFISHHLAHAWASVALSGFDECAVVVIDVMGSCLGALTEIPCPLLLTDGHLYARERESIYHFEKGHMRPLLKRASYPTEDSRYNPYALKTYDGVGGLYEVVGQYLFQQELMGGKVMGLASYGKPHGAEPLFSFHRGLPEVTRTGWTAEYETPGEWKTNFPRAAALASRAQKELEGALLEVVDQAYKMTASPRVCLSGGMMLNGLATELVRQKYGHENVFVPPACNDGGISIGCAYAARQRHEGWTGQFPLRHDFLGREYTRMHCLEVAGRDPRVQFLGETNANRLAAELERGRIAAYFTGGAEFGPRALGHRSILAAPNFTDIRRRLSQEVKQREWFRPLAPCVCEEEAPKYFELEGASPFMLRVCRVRPSFRAALRGIVHVDGTARVQTVSREVHPELHSLLSCYGERSGIPVLINTSFNSRGMPLVETPWDALDTFLARPIDLLYLEGNLLSKRSLDSWDWSKVRPKVAQMESFEWGETLDAGESLFCKAVRPRGSCCEPIALTEEHVAVLSRCNGSETLEAALRNDGRLKVAAAELWDRGIITWDASNQADAMSCGP